MYTIKRSIGFSLILFLSSLSGFPKEGQGPARKDSLYSVALFASVSEMEKSWGHIDDSNGGRRTRTNYRHVLVEKDPEITEGLPLQQGDYRVEYLDFQEQMERYKTLGKEFAILRIGPMKSDGSVLKVEVSVSYVKYEKHKFLRAISDWSDVEFHYDCENQKFVVAGVKLGGI
jgi:hypothetical protein